MINASWGLGESNLGGRVNPDVFVIDKGGLTVTERKINDKRTMTVPLKTGTREVKVPCLFRCKPALSDQQAIEIARLAIGLERKASYAVDIECAITVGRPYLLQCRRVSNGDAR